MEKREEERKVGIEMEELPEAILGTIMTKLDMSSICSVATTCRTLRSCASHILSFLPHVHLLDVAPSLDLLVHLLPQNPYLTSLKIDCCRLDDSAIQHVVRPSVRELFLHNCGDFSGRLLYELGSRCHELRCLYLGSVGEKRGRTIQISDLEELLRGCCELETLNLMFDVSIFLHHKFAGAWTLASTKLSSLEISYIPSMMVIELLSPRVGTTVPPNHFREHVEPSILPNLQKLSLSVDCITDALVSTISKSLTSLIHLDLRDVPMSEPPVTSDLTNNGLQHINQHGKLKHLSLVRSQEYASSYFRRVNDLGILLMADRCVSMESICLGGFCLVTDTGFRAILHSCANLYKIKISHGIKLTDLVFLDISATPLSLTYVGLRWCNLLTNLAITQIASNLDLCVLDLRDCRSLGDEALHAISNLPKLKSLMIDGSDVSDVGISYLRDRAASSLVTLSVRGCKRLTDKCITALLGGTSKPVLQELDLSNLPNFSDNGVLLLAKSRVAIRELRMRQCALIGDTSVMALASMQVDDERWHGNSLCVLDLYNCGRISALSFRWLKKPYFPKLKWLGVTGSVNRDMVDALARSRPFLHVACRGEELGTGQWDHADGFCIYDYDEMDELERFILEGNDNISDEDMAEAEHNDELEE